MLEINIQDLEPCNGLITHLITLRLTLKYILKVKKILGTEIGKLEKKEINELTVLKDKIFIMTLRNRYLGKSSYDIDVEEEIDLIKQEGKKIDKIKELKKDVMEESKAAKMFQDLEYEKIDTITGIVDMIKNNS